MQTNKKLKEAVEAAVHTMNRWSIVPEARVFEGSRGLGVKVLSWDRNRGMINAGAASFNVYDKNGNPDGYTMEIPVYGPEDL